MGNYDQRKLEEQGRLHNVLEQLNKVSVRLSPPGPSTEPPSGSVALLTPSHNVDKMTKIFIHSDAQKEDVEDGAEDSDEDDSDEDTADKVDSPKDESQASTAPPQSEPCIYTVLSDFTGDQEGDLTVQVI